MRLPPWLPQAWVEHLTPTGEVALKKMQNEDEDGIDHSHAP